MPIKLPKPINEKTGEPSWRYRRLAIFLVSIWACYQLAELVDAADSRLNETIAWGWQLILIALVLGYTGFASIQDIVAIYTTRSGRPYSPDIQQLPPDPVVPDTVTVVNNVPPPDPAP